MTWLTSAPSGPNSKIRSLLFFRVATASRPSQTPQWAPSRKMPPLVARVTRPDDHLASTAPGNLIRSVIATLWL